MGKGWTTEWTAVGKLVHGISLQRKIKLDPYLSPYTKGRLPFNLEGLKNLRVKSKMIKG